MRSDYVLYVAAVICLIIAGVFFAISNQLEGNLGLVATAVFLILGILSAAGGYALRPKVAVSTPIIPQTPAVEPSPPPTPPTLIEERVEEAPAPLPPEEEVPAAPPPQPEPALEAAPEPTPGPIIEPTAPTLAEPPKAEITEEKPVEKPAEKRVRRRRRKKTE